MRSHTPNNALSLNEELIELRKHVKEQDKEIRRLKEENEFLEVDICAEDECNDTYGRIRMHQALELKQPAGITVQSERTVPIQLYNKLNADMLM